LAPFILSYQCPFTDGSIVYQARTLHNHSPLGEQEGPYAARLLSGIYFVHLINEKGEKSVKKLIIAKE